MQHIVFKKIVHIQVAGVKDWIVTPETVDGIDFVEIHMKDSGFSRYVTGTTTGIRGMQFLNELRVMQTTAITAASHTLKLEASIDQGAPIAVELDEGNMQYLKLAMLAGVAKLPTNKPSEPTKSASNVHWRAERSAYVGWRSCSSTGKTVYKTFKVAAEDDKISIRDLAVQWVSEVEV